MFIVAHQTWCSLSTIILNNATILESILLKIITRKHIQEFDINNDVSLFNDKRQFRCQAMTTIFDIWIRSLYCREFCAITDETKINYFWFVISTKQTKTKYCDTMIACTFDQQNEIFVEFEFWSNYRCETHLIEHCWYKTHLIKHFDVKRILKSIRKYCNSNYAKWFIEHRTRFCDFDMQVTIVNCKIYKSCKHLDKIWTCKRESRNITKS